MTQERFWTLMAKKISKEATESELAELEELIRLYPEWFYSAQQLQNMWDLPVKDDGSASEQAFLQHLKDMEKAGVDISLWNNEDQDRSEIRKTIPFYKRKWYPWLVAACIMGFVSMLFLKDVFTKNSAIVTTAKTSEVSTHNGSKSKLVLPDGSTVWLNADSKLTYEKEFGTHSRHVTLEGEAFFDVVKMPEVPFIIQTKVIQIKVLGTAFNVKSYGDEPTTETSLVSGKVEITVNKRPEEKHILLPNNKLIVANETEERKMIALNKETKKIPLVSVQELTYYKGGNTIIETSWKENKLVFQDESFADIARKLERWYNVKIVFGNKSLEAERLTGSFTDESIIQALEALQITGTEFDFKIEQNKIFLTR
jgi:ferric-dicitrate binding protein FerR (iron transport regulator)